jgi:hypothetical protein
MSNSSNDNTDFNNGDDALRDPALQRALDHAPDHDATPDPRTRDAIRKMAHNLAAAPVLTPVSVADGAGAAPWWRRLFGGGGTGARMPWNAAFATVLVATFVAVLWHREPVPDAQLDGEARVSGAAAPTPAPAQPSAQPAPQSPSPAAVAPQAPAAPAAEPPAASARDSSKDAVDSRAADAVRRAPAPSSKQAAPAPEISRKPVESPPPSPPSELAAAPAMTPPAPVVPAPPAPAAAAPGIAEQSTPPRERNESESGGREKRSAYVGGAPAAPPSTTDLERVPPAPAVAAAAPAAPAAAPAHRELADSPPAVAAQGNADAAASGALRQQAPSRAIAAAKVARPSADTASFSALDRWTSFNFTRTGPGGRHARGDIEGLAALVNTVARSATAADAQLVAPVEARLELYRGGALLAVLEIAGDQVRWTPQSGGTASVGTPPAQALDALRALLTR